VREKCAKTFVRVVQKPCAARIVLQDSERGDGLAEQGIEIAVIRQGSQTHSEATLSLHSPLFRHILMLRWHNLIRTSGATIKVRRDYRSITLKAFGYIFRDETASRGVRERSGRKSSAR